MNLVSYLDRALRKPRAGSRGRPRGGVTEGRGTRADSVETDRSAHAVIPAARPNDGTSSTKQGLQPASGPDREAFLYETVRQRVSQHGLWYIDAVTLVGGLGIRGWAISPQGWFREATLTVNGRRFTRIEIDRDRPDVVRYCQVDPERVIGFRCSIDWKDLPEGTKDFRFAYADARTLAPLVDTHCKHFYDIEAPMPDPARRIRVAGTDNLNEFIKFGAQNYGILVDALERAFGKTFDDFRDVLDWGCGCGRVMRYVSARHALNLIGVDIDADTIAWCKSAFPTCSFHAIDLDPPLPLAAESIDLVYGISVFTHLSERDQFKWLEELRRITRPGGVLLLSIHGDHAWFRNGLAPADFVDWKRKGFRDDHADTVLEDVISDPNYYRSVFHDIRYVIREWGRYFRVVEHIPGMLQDNQDLVVLARE